MMPFPVFFDTCALYGELVNDVFLRLSEMRLFTPYWSEDILSELQRVLSERIGENRAERRVEAMREAFPDSIITGYQGLVQEMTCSEEDKHVLAAASYSPADTLVTFNIKDFPESATSAVGMEVKHPDQFLLDVFDLYPGPVGQACSQIISVNRRCPQTPEEFAKLLERSGLPGASRAIYPTVAALHFHMANGSGRRE